ncbi:tetratricopeptide repeat protein [Ancylobacter terrae]|uniref:tetratricopeptide repeat protein n=1 Tax=Ancylobacter sp. sgz301288 TaxID=3342077 RepID=UPI00385F7D19
MADIFHEIDEDLRRERLGRIWSRYGAYIIGLAVLIVAAVAAWRGYEWYQTREAQASGARFAEALALSEAGKHAEAEAAFAALGKDGTNGYRILARFRAANELAPTDKAAAVAAYDALAADGGIDPLARDIARLRAGMLLVDTAPAVEIESRLKDLDTPTGPFRHTARELIALAQYRAGDLAGAAKTIDAALADAEAPPGLRQRAQLLQALTSGAGILNSTPPATQ